MSPQRGGEDASAAPRGGRRGAANERAAEARPFRPRRGRLGSHGGWTAAGAGSARPLFRAPLPLQRLTGRCQLHQRPTEPRCMLRRCGRRLLYVLGLSFPLLTGRPLFLCPHRLMRPQVVFVLGGPGAGKGTQCARIVEVRPGQPAAPCA